MNRLEQALQRARIAGRDEVPGAGILPEGVPEPDVFVAPWDVGSQTHVEERAREAPANPPSHGPSLARARAGSTVMAAQPRTATIHRDLVEKVVAGDSIPGPAVEQYRKLAAKLHYAQLERQVKTVMIISAVAAEGKTLTSMNLALTLSRSYKRKVLLIDADLRRPRLHEAFGLRAASGLHEAVIGETPGTSTVPVFDIGHGVWLLPAGRPTADPMAVLTSERMREILTEARKTYDWVIIDTAPLAVLPDAHVLRDAVDTAVLVVSAGHTEYELVNRAVSLLGREHIVGVVLNGVDRREMPAAYYNYDYPGS